MSRGEVFGSAMTLHAKLPRRARKREGRAVGRVVGCTEDITVVPFITSGVPAVVGGALESVLCSSG
jgi:hypothetical protein